ncbi:MAG: hypothetical protein ABGX16_18450, partial [Pirellulales bacterium]
MKHKPRLPREITFGERCDLTLTAGIAATDGVEAKLPTFEIRAYNGGPLKVGNFKYPVIVDLQGMQATKKARPALVDHDTSKRVGHTTAVDIQATHVDIRGIVSSVSLDASEVVQSSLNGFPWQASVGLFFPKPVQYLAAGRRATVNGKEHVGPAYVARESILKEI